MKKIICGATIYMLLAAMGATAQAQSITFSTVQWWTPIAGYPVIVGYENFGAWCAGMVPNGDWGFAFGYYNPNMQCARVNQHLLSTTGVNGTLTSHGAFRLNGWNNVAVRCDNFAYYRSGYGARPLRDVYRRAASSGASFCRFSVTY